MGRRIDPSKFVTLFTDASFCPRTKAWGWAAWAKHGSPAETLRNFGGGFDCPGSNEAEARALRHGIDMLLEEEVDLRDKIVVIQSDCTSALASLDESLLISAGAKFVRRKHVKGHQGLKDPRSSVNTWADKEAYREMAYRRRHAEEKAS